MSSQVQIEKMSMWVYAIPMVPVVIWGTNMVVTRYAASVIEPVSISFWRLLIACIVILPFVYKSAAEQQKIILKNIVKLTILSFLAMVIYQCLSYTAGHTTTATNMSIINAFIPIFTIFVSLIVMGERPTIYGISGSVISITGLFFLIGRGSFIGLFQGGFHFGDALMIVAVIAYALYGVLLRYWKLPITLGASLFAQTALGLLMHLPLLCIFGLQLVDAHSAFSVFYAALLPSIVAPFMWMKAMQTLGPNRSSMFTNFGPIITAVIAYVYLNEQWMYYHTIGTVMAIIGVILAQKKTISV